MHFGSTCLMAHAGALKRKRHNSCLQAPGVSKKARLDRKPAPSVHHQTSLLHKSIKKAKQFELRKLIRRLKASTSGQDIATPESAEVAQQRLQDKYDITKQISLDAVLDLALAECGLAQEKPVQDGPCNKFTTDSGYKQNDVTLVCKKLLSARCVRQQIEAMQERQLQQTQLAAAATAPQCSKQSTDSEGAMHTNKLAGSDATAGCSIAEESSQGCIADIVEPAVASAIDNETSAAAAGMSPCLRLNDVDSVPADWEITPGAVQNAMPMRSMPQPHESVTQHKSKASEERQSQEGKPTLAGGHSQKHKKNGKAVDAPEQVKSKNKKKKNRLGQRARQQLGRAKEAGLNEGQLRRGSSGTGLTEMPARGKQAPGHLQAAFVSTVQPDKSAQAVRLHPSWLAKQKQKEALVKAVSVGSKTVFSDDGQSFDLRPAIVASTGTSGVPPVRQKPQSVQKEVLHPSWLAKKAAAAKQAQLAGSSAATKMTFED